MRILIAVLAMLVVVFLATQAKADLVADLRSGRSDIKAAPNSIRQVRGFDQIYEKSLSYPKYVAMVAQWYGRYGNWTTYGADSAEMAIKTALRRCEDRWGGTCRVYSVGKKIVIGFSQKKLAAAIEAYDRGNKKTVTEKREAEGAGIERSNDRYCKNNYGKVHKAFNGDCPLHYPTPITKAEYDRLKNKKTVTAHKSTESSKYRKLFCQYGSTKPAITLWAYACPVGTKEITKAEYDRLKSKLAEQKKEEEMQKQQD